MSDPDNKYLILGHGTESLIDFNDRPQIPEGIRLVTIAECGSITTRDEVCPMVEAFTRQENSEILGNPQAHKETIKGFLNGKDFHYYKEGDKYPKLTLQMFLDWPSDTETEVFKSGTYTFPLESETCNTLFKKIGPYKDGRKLFERLIPDDYMSDFMYKGSIKPLQSEVDEILQNTKNVNILKKSLTVSLEDIFKTGGPGIYYYVVCRSIKDVLTPQQYVREMQLNEDNSKRYEPYYKKDWISNIPAILPLIEENIATLPKWQQSTAIQVKKNYEGLHRVRSVRRRSIHQQTRLGGKRKSVAKKSTKRKPRKCRSPIQAS
jgi:hypothetical protein